MYLSVIINAFGIMVIVLIGVIYNKLIERPLATVVGRAMEKIKLSVK